MFCLLKFTKPEIKYIQSYWETFDTIAKENIYLAATKAFPLESTIEFVNSSIEKKLPHLLVIDTEFDCCVGWCDAMPKSETVGYLGTGLLSKYREQGIGKRLIREVIDLSKEYGYRYIELDVRSSNKRAIHVYMQLGFVITNIVADGFAHMGNAVMEDVVHMSLDLIAKN
ncbi:MAG: N-acetyltransferase family protein [Negativicutes bacterium]